MATYFDTNNGFAGLDQSAQPLEATIPTNVGNLLIDNALTLKQVLTALLALEGGVTTFSGNSVTFKNQEGSVVATLTFNSAIPGNITGSTIT